MIAALITTAATSTAATTSLTTTSLTTTPRICETAGGRAVVFCDLPKDVQAFCATTKAIWEACYNIIQHNGVTGDICSVEAIISEMI